MDIYIIFIVIGAILFISSIYLWFKSGVIRRKNRDMAKKDDRIGGYMFMTSLLLFIIALLIYFLT